MPDTDSNETLDGITVRLAEVCYLVSEGYSQPEIAQQLGIEPSTVKSHIELLQDRTGCATMPELLRWWRRQRGHWIRRIAQRTGLADVI